MNVRITGQLLTCALAIALITACIDRSLDVTDPDYPPDGYSITPQWSAVDTGNLRIIALYRIPFSLGKESFKTLTARFSRPDLLDTALFSKEFMDNRLALYFLAPGSCTLTLDGLHPNNRHTTVTTVLTAENPYRISGDTLLGVTETGRYCLLPRPEFDSTNLDLRTGWRLDTGSITPLEPGDTFTFAAVRPGSMTLSALLIDSVYGHTVAVDSLPLLFPGYRPSFDSVQVVTDTIVPGDRPRVRIFVNDRDSGSLSALMVSEIPRIWNDTFDLTGPLMYSSILTKKVPVRDTGCIRFSVSVTDPAGLASPIKSGSFTVKADPPLVRFVPDTTEIALLADMVQTLLVTATADTFVWNIDGEDTVTTSPLLQRIFITGSKKTANVSVYGIDRYGYRGPMASVRIVEETSPYDLRFTHVPGDSAYRDSANWTVVTSRTDRVHDNHAVFCWNIIRLGSGDTIGRFETAPQGDSGSTFRIAMLSDSGVNLDSIDLKVCVVLRDTLGPDHSSPLRIDSSRIRLFRPVITVGKIVPRGDSVAVGQEMTVRFIAQDVNRNGHIDSVFWKQSGIATVYALPADADSMAMRHASPGPVTILLWTRDNDGEISDTARIQLHVVKNRPRITSLIMSRPVVYALERCTLSVTIETGILRSPVQKTVWRCSDDSAADTVVHGLVLSLSFSSPGKKTVSVTAIDAQGDTSHIFTDTITIVSGRPTVIVADAPDSISTGMPATIIFALSDLKSLIDTVYWQDDEARAIHTIAIPCLDSSVTCTWQQPGTRTILLWARDRIGDMSDTVSAAIVVVQNRPRITGFHRPQGTVYSHLPCTVAVSAQPGFSQCRITAWCWDVPNDVSINDTITGDSSLSTVFDSPGKKRFSVIVIDSLGDSSAAFTDSIVVDPGLPRVTAVSFDTTGQGVFVNDQIHFTVSATDPNGSVNQYRVVLKKQGTDDSLLTQGSSSRLPCILPVGNDGVYSVIAYAMDDDSLWSAAFVHPRHLMVRAGWPFITANHPEESWMYDLVTLYVQVVDTNGMIHALACEWDDGSADTIRYASPQQDVRDTLSHRYVSHGTRQVRLTATDDDGLASVRTLTITVNKGAPSVSAAADTFVWYDNKGGFRGDTINFHATAEDSNGTISRYVWILSGALDTSASDTVITAADSLLIGAANSAFWADHGRLRPDTTYKGAVFVIDDDGLKSLPDTFCYYVDAPRSFSVAAQAREGHSGDRTIYELINANGTSSNDSLFITIQDIAPGDTNFLSVKIDLVVDSITDFVNPATPYDDSISVSSTPGFSLLKRFTPKQSNPGFFCDTLSNRWLLMYRPPSSDFSPYKQQIQIPQPWLFFHVRVSLQTRTDAIQTASSPVQLRMNSTLLFVP
ncbi:MAG: PKD domain-containing protein [Chitinispirillaceae bacterium]|nr:PKD domain-containing protein [Chitinispirillaceae bacterium]